MGHYNILEDLERDSASHPPLRGPSHLIFHSKLREAGFASPPPIPCVGLNGLHGPLHRDENIEVYEGKVAHTLRLAVFGAFSWAVR